MSNDESELEKRRAEQLAELRAEEGLGMMTRMAIFLSRDRRGVLSPDELRSVGYIALRKAAEHFDIAKLTPFPVYAYMWVRGAMLKALKEEHHVMSGMNEVGYRALAVLEDTADILHDSEEQHSQRLDEPCDALLVSVICGAVGKASTDESFACEMGFATPDGTIPLS